MKRKDMKTFSDIMAERQQDGIKSARHDGKQSITIRFGEEDKPELIGQIIDLFDDFLEEKGIHLGSDTSDENAAVIQGEDYDVLADGLDEIIRRWSRK